VQLRERQGAAPRWADDIDLGVERDQGLREIAGIGRDALFRCAEHGVRTIEAVDRRAAGSRVALVAIGVADIAEIAAACPLQDIASERCHVAELRTGGKLQ